MKRKNKAQFLLLVLTGSGLVLRKLLVPGASILLIVTLSMLGILFFALCIRNILRIKKENYASLLFAVAYFDFFLCSFGFLFRIQYWDDDKQLVWIAFFAMMILAVLLIHYFIFMETDHEIERKLIRELLIPFLFFLMVIPFSAMANQRQFHNFFRGSIFESYIRKLYPENQARLILEENQCDDPACLIRAEEYYLQGLKNDSLKKYDEAFVCYNKAIDLNIHFTDAYCSRAANRMLHAVVDEDIIASAIRDCNIAIAIDPDYAPAYLRRGYTYMYLRKKEKACSDFIKARALNGALKLDAMIKSNCGE